MKIRKWSQNNVETLYCFYCPGCESEHVITSVIHTVTGDENTPTISPSILYNQYTPICHSFINNGRIQFLSDCTHKFAGQTIDLPDLNK